VPYKGGGPQIGALMGGQTSAAIAALPAAIQFIRQGTFKALAVTTATRSPALPEVPTMTELGLPGIDVSQWYGVFLPHGASPSIVTQLNASFVWAINEPDLRSKILDMGYEAMGDTPEQFQTLVRDEIAKYRKIVTDTKIGNQQ
jgi:tripartite-type tricarboxylate transporter receptor subunit TctC